MNRSLGGNNRRPRVPWYMTFDHRIPGKDRTQAMTASEVQKKSHPSLLSISENVVSSMKSLTLIPALCLRMTPFLKSASMW